MHSDQCKRRSFAFNRQNTLLGTSVPGRGMPEAIITSVLIPMLPVTGDLAVKADSATVGEVVGLSPMHRYLILLSDSTNYIICHNII